MLKPKLRPHLVSAVLTSWVLAAPVAVAQEPETPPQPAASPPAGEPPAAEADQDAPPRRPGRGRARRPTIVIAAGTIHPVATPPIENGLIVVRGDRIVAVGKQGEVELPENAVVHSFPTGHVYPGLIDAGTDAFTDRALRADGALDGGVALSDGLFWLGERDDRLVEAGITTAYVAVRSGAQLRGQGAIVRPRADGFDLWEKREQAGVELRMAQGAGPTHPLQRQQQLEALDNLFEGLDDYRKAKTDFDEALQKYDKEFAAWLEFHEKKKDKKGDAPKAEGGEKPPAEKPADAPPTPPAEGEGPGNRRRRGGRPPGGGGNAADGSPEDRSPEDAEQAVAAWLAALTGAAPARAQDPKPAGQEPKPEPAKQDPAAGAAKPGEGGDSAEPKRPTYPKKPPPDPQKDALLDVLDGKLPLRVEAQRADELRAALRLQREHKIPLLVLEQAYGADRLAAEIAEQGATVVLTDLLPDALGATDDKKNPFAGFDPAALPARLDAAGVPFAIASGTARLSPLLPMLAAVAVGRGLAPAAALRAITLTPAEILGVAESTGSLASGKYADVLVTDRPLFATDSRPLLVLARGRTEYQAK